MALSLSPSHNHLRPGCRIAVTSFPADCQQFRKGSGSPLLCPCLLSLSLCLCGLLLCDAGQFNLLMSSNLPRMQRINVATVRANRRSFENLKTFRTTPNRKVPFRIDGRPFSRGLIQIPLHVSIKQRVAGVVAHAIDDFGHLPRLVSHRSHALLPVQRMALCGSQQDAAADLIDRYSLTDYSNVAKNGKFTSSEIVQDLLSPSWWRSSR